MGRLRRWLWREANVRVVVNVIDSRGKVLVRALDEERLVADGDTIKVDLDYEMTWTAK